MLFNYWELYMPENSLILSGYISGLTLWPPLNDIKPFRDKQVDLTTISEISSEVSEITYIGHTERNLISSGVKAANLTPQEFAQLICNKYADNDKDNLKDFYFIACEAGLGNPSYADMFLKEMNKLGFTELTVHAATPSESLYSMVVESNLNDYTLFRAWGYRTKADKQREYELENLIEKGRQKGLVTDPEEIEQRINLEEEVLNSRFYISKQFKDYKTLLNEPGNSYHYTAEQQYKLMEEKVEKFSKSPGVKIAQSIGLKTPNYDAYANTFKKLKTKVQAVKSEDEIQPTSPKSSNRA